MNEWVNQTAPKSVNQTVTLGVQEEREKIQAA
jgi:hypothetical protein